MDHRQHHNTVDLTDGMIPGLCVISAIIDPGENRTFENPDGERKAEAVLFHIAFVLLFIPLEHAHS
ncbi:hypothetical protein A6U92_18320 [Agrobacterium rubi]|nr:hypothetical protein A6U92_18320 [Agrobacterium rubi]